MYVYRTDGKKKCIREALARVEAEAAARFVILL